MQSQDYSPGGYIPRQRLRLRRLVVLSHTLSDVSQIQLARGMTPETGEALASLMKRTGDVGESIVRLSDTRHRTPEREEATAAELAAVEADAREAFPNYFETELPLVSVAVPDSPPFG